LSAPHIAVVGGGYSGTLQAIELLRRGARVTLIERAPHFARGAAYGTEQPDHLLNVRAAGMSAFADQPDHFASWFAREADGRPDGFAQRRVYGRYLGDLLHDARAEHGEGLQTLHAEVASIETIGAGERLQLRDGARVETDAAILAIGNLPPEPTRGIRPAELPANVYVENPWAGDLALGLSADDVVLMVGTGLTAVDAALVLESAGFGGRILALSRRGLLPRAHADIPLSPQPLAERPEPRCTSLLGFVRGSSDDDWRSKVDSLRPVTQQLWRDASVAERHRFLRHLRPWWDVHRHRIAPAIAARIERLRSEGRLDVQAGRVVEAQPDGEGARVRWRPRGAEEERSLRVRRIVNCTGPQADIARAGEPLLDSLLAAGRVRPDPCRIGIDVDGAYRTLGKSGEPSDTLFAVGPMTRGAFWEIVAIPDIRHQVRALADALTAPDA
jgi:uncharacterized NAD(P)/FAD-binding protein YdhS